MKKLLNLTKKNKIAGKKKNPLICTKIKGFFQFPAKKQRSKMPIDGVLTVGSMFDTCGFCLGVRAGWTKKERSPGRIAGLPFVPFLFFCAKRKKILKARFLL